MILKTLENLGDEPRRAVPGPLASAVRLNDRVRTSIGDRLGFRRHVDETDAEEHQGDENAPNDDEEDEANRQHGVQGAQQRAKQRPGTEAGVTWVGVADMLKKICFAFYVLFYLSFMFAWLC